MSRRKQYKHLLESNFMGIFDKIKIFRKSNRRNKTKANNNK
jgi:hypothetical protein